MSRGNAQLNKRELVISTWRGLGEPRVGEDELRRIQIAMSEAFGPGGLLSPAAIARILADEEAELRHPEIIEFDAQWREARIDTETKRFESVDKLLANAPLRLRSAESVIKKSEKLRQLFEVANDREALEHLRRLVVDARQQAQSTSRDPKLDETLRTEQKEIVQWLTVWLQTPNLFDDWLELRRRSPEFRERFPAR